MKTEILRGVPPYLKVYTDPLPEYDNWNFARGSPTELYLPLEPTQLFSISITQSTFFCIYLYLH